ncbi:MAG: alpha/beta fold hydrolase [Erysipelotrichaceae bacterium]|nr:alpha/beta fold hydrolase [Erysipelotrichaceae bacterium]
MEKKLTVTNKEDGVVLHGNLFYDDNSKKGLILLLHGMAEHKERYAHTIEKLVENGYAVLSTDERGHGESAIVKGYFAKEKGWLRNVSDQYALYQEAKKTCDLPLIVFGHSMGTLVARSFLKRHEDEVTKVVLTGTPSNNKAVNVAITLCNVIKKFKGEEYRSPLLNKLCFGAFNSAIKDPKTDYDWLSVNEENVKAYIADDDCGYTFTVLGFKDMFEGMKDVYEAAGWKIRKNDLPIRFFSGSEDPCMGNLDGLKEAVDILKSFGYQNVDYKTYEGYRHEILNEEIRDDVINDIVEFLDK